MPTLQRLLAFVLMVGAASVVQATTIVVDNGTPQVTETGAWLPATAATSHFGTVSEYANSSGTGANTKRFTPGLPVAGSYRVEVWNACFTPRGTNVPHLVNSNDPPTVVPVDQNASCGAWALLGVFSFAAGSAGYVEISDAGVSEAYVGADAVRFTRTVDLRIDHASDDGSTLTLNASNLKTGVALDVSISCADPSVACASVGNEMALLGQTTPASVSEIIQVGLPAGIAPGTYRVRIDDGTDTAEIHHTVFDEARIAQIEALLADISAGPGCASAPAGMNCVSYDGECWCASAGAVQTGNQLCGRASGYAGTYYSITGRSSANLTPPPDGDRARAIIAALGGMPHQSHCVARVECDVDCATNIWSLSGSWGTSLTCWTNDQRWNRGNNIVRCTNYEQ